MQIFGTLSAFAAAVAFLADVLVAPALLADQERIEAVYQRSGAYEDEWTRLPPREIKLAALEREIDGLDVGAASELLGDRLQSMRAAVAQIGSTRTLLGEGATLGILSSRVLAVQAQCTHVSSRIR